MKRIIHLHKIVSSLFCSPNPVKACLAILLFTSILAKGQGNTPNIILILADDIGYETLGVNGSQSYLTPVLDGMTNNGMNFTKCHSSPSCSPSRFSLLTGKYNFRNYTDWGSMNLNQKTLGNLFKDAGYRTACYGKWQFGGGGNAVNAFGFDNYCLWNALENTDSTNRYKNPLLYQKGGYIANNLTKGKYGEDIFCDSVLNFIDSNKNAPFFIYYPMALCHSPQSPTPDDTAFAAWDPDLNRSENAFFPSMVNYMDKKIGLIVDKLEASGIDNNTLIIFLGDNGTAGTVASLQSDDLIVGGKGTTIETGTHVPMILYWPGTIAGGTINSDLIGFTDFMPTLAKLCNISLPLQNGTIDGVDFSQGIKGQPGNPRNWIFNDYNPRIHEITPTRWAQSREYKLYDTNTLRTNFEFYNILNDILEQYPLNNAELTFKEDSIKHVLFSVIEDYKEQSKNIPIISTPQLSLITDSSARLGASLVSDDSVAVFDKGIVYARNISVKATDNVTRFSEANSSDYSTLITGVEPQRKYYFKGYGINDNGTGLSGVDSFYTLSKPVKSIPDSLMVLPSYGTVKLNWSHAQFPEKGAKKGGYLIIYSEAEPLLIDLPNGLPPDSIVSRGNILFNTSAILPKLPSNSVTSKGFIAGLTYNFLLVPYTWNGSNNETYNYLWQQARKISCIIPVPPNPKIKSLTPLSTVFADSVTITVNGSNFINQLSSIYFNGIELPTAFISGKRLSAVIKAPMLINPGNASITVVTIGAIAPSNKKRLTLLDSSYPLFITDISTLKSFSQVCTNSVSDVQTFLLSGSSLDGSNITIGPLAGYIFSTSADGIFTNSLSIGGYGRSLSIPVYIKFLPQDIQEYNAEIPVIGGGAASKYITVKGTGIFSESRVFTNPIATGVTQNSATVGGNIYQGCTEINNYGIAVSKNEAMANLSLMSSSNFLDSSFKIALSELLPGITYYFKAYGIMGNDTIYGQSSQFTTLPLIAPESLSATEIFQTKIKANWTNVSGAADYRLDVDTAMDFGYGVIAGWTFPDSPDNALVDSANSSNNNRSLSIVGSKGLAFNASGATTNAAIATGWHNGIGNKYWQIEFDATGYYGITVSSKQRSSSNGPADFMLQYRLDSLGDWMDVIGGSIVVGSNFNSGILDNVLLPENCNNEPRVFLRWVISSTRNLNNGIIQIAGSNRIDDLLIRGYEMSIPGYGNKVIQGTSQVVTGLTPNKNYFYRVRANAESNVSVNSNTVNLKTLEVLSCTLSVDPVIPCQSNTGGTITAIGSGGTGVYTYSIDGGLNYFLSGKFENLSPGNYTVIVKDATNDKVERNFVIELPIENNVSVNHTDLLCFGSAQGSIIIEAEGPDLYNYYIGSDSNNTGIFNNLPAGTYNYRVTNNTGCIIDTGQVLLLEPPLLSAKETHTPIIMEGEMSLVTISGEGGSGSYSGTGEFMQNAGTKTYVISDSNGCIASIDVTVNGALPITYTQPEKIDSGHIIYSKTANLQRREGNN